MYSVMQSDGNSFGGDVVSDSSNKTSLDEDNNSDEIYKKHMCSQSCYDDFNSL